MMVPDLSICIINHRTPALTEACVRSIIATMADLRLEVFVVNNTGDDVEQLASLSQQGPNIQVIQNPYPLGFAANQNQMLQQATGRYLLSLNSDTLVQPGALEELIDFMEAHPQVGIAGPKLIYPDGQLQPSCRNFPTPLTHFLEASGLWYRFRANPLVGRYYYLCSPHQTVQNVDWLTGACLIVRSTAAQQVGYYDADTFVESYGEDIDWCWRMRQAGWLVMFDPQAIVIHLESQSPMTDRSLTMYRGFYRFCARYYSPAHQWAIRMVTILALLPRWLLARSREARSLYSELIALPMPSATPKKAANL
jgi:GT2 family glycosyltransferase